LAWVSFTGGQKNSFVPQFDDDLGFGTDLLLGARDAIQLLAAGAIKAIAYSRARGVLISNRTTRQP